MEFQMAANVAKSPIEKTLLGQTPLTRTIGFRIAAGQSLPAHTAPHWVHMIIVQGEGRFLTGEGAGEPAVAGSYRVFAPNAPHGLAAITPLEAIAIIVQGDR
jgi:quercetin dioxygenase-like cupin family protein